MNGFGQDCEKYSYASYVTKEKKLSVGAPDLENITEDIALFEKKSRNVIYNDEPYCNSIVE